MVGASVHLLSALGPGTVGLGTSFNRRTLLVLVSSPSDLLYSMVISAFEVGTAGLEIQCSCLDRFQIALDLCSPCGFAPPSLQIRGRE
jgi:hypothetical protein